MTRLQVAGWVLVFAASAVLGVLLAVHDQPAAVSQLARPTAIDPDIGWTTTTDPGGW